MWFFVIIEEILLQFKMSSFYCYIEKFKWTTLCAVTKVINNHILPINVHIWMVHAFTHAFTHVIYPPSQKYVPILKAFVFPSWILVNILMFLKNILLHISFNGRLTIIVDPGDQWWSLPPYVTNVWKNHLVVVVICESFLDLCPCVLCVGHKSNKVIWKNH